MGKVILISWLVLADSSAWAFSEQTKNTVELLRNSDEKVFSLLYRDVLKSFAFQQAVKILKNDCDGFEVLLERAQQEQAEAEAQLLKEVPVELRERVFIALSELREESPELQQYIREQLSRDKQFLCREVANYRK